MAVIQINRTGRATRYEVRYGYHRTPDGRQRYKTRSFSSRSDADDFDRSVRGVAITPETATVAMIAAAWEAEAWPELAPRTRTGYDKHLRLRILPYLGSRIADKLTPRILDDWQQWMIAQRSLKDDKQLISPSTANGTLRTMRALLRWARRKGYCTTRVADDTKALPETSTHQPRPLSGDEVRSVAAACQTLIEATIVLVAAYTGLRWSELRALEWGDIELDNSLLRVRRAADPHHTIGKVKSKAALRSVPILAPGVDALTAWQSATKHPSGLVFPDEQGRVMADDWFGNRIRRLRKASGVSFTLHNLRDTYCSIHVAAGTPAAELATIVGHTSLQTTLRHYAGTHDSRVADIASRVNEVLWSL